MMRMRVIKAIKVLLPSAGHKLCTRRVYANLGNKKGGLKYMNVFWRLAKASNKLYFNRLKGKMHDLSPGTWEFVD